MGTCRYGPRVKCGDMPLRFSGEVGDMPLRSSGEVWGHAVKVPG